MLEYIKELTSSTTTLWGFIAILLFATISLKILVNFVLGLVNTVVQKTKEETHEPPKKKEPTLGVDPNGEIVFKYKV